MGTVCVVGSFMMDLVARTSRLPKPGETVIGESFDMFLGGKGFNQAIAAARSGADVAVVGRVGDDDFGQQFISALEADEVDHRGVSIDPRMGTGVGLPVVESSGQNAITVMPLANHTLTPELLPVDVIANASVVLLQWELPEAVTVAAARVGRAAGATVILNPAPAVGNMRVFDGLIDLLVPNETEAAVLGHDIVAGVHQVLTLGDRGVRIIERDGVRTEIKGHRVHCVDSTGAGDAFCGAFSASLAAGASVIEAARIGNAAGACAVTVAGAEPSMPTSVHIERMLKS